MCKSYRKKLRHKNLLKFMTPDLRGTILDLSYGDGSYIKLIHDEKTNTELHGIDISAELISENKQKYPFAQFNIAPATALPFPDNSFNVVSSDMSLHHYENLEMVLNEVQRTLKPNGIFYLSDLILQNSLSLRIYNFFKCPESYHFEKFYSEHLLLEVVSKHGFKFVIKHRLSKFRPLYSYKFIKQ